MGRGEGKEGRKGLGSGGNGGGRRESPEVEDDGCTAEAHAGRAQ